MTKRQVGDFETRIQGIPCQIVIDFYERTPGSYNYNAPSDLDYYGYLDCNFTVLDRKGYPAEWLAKKMTADDISRIEDIAVDYMESLADQNQQEYYESVYDSLDF